MYKQQKGSIAPLSVFISYAHQDKVLCDELKKHLSSLRREGIITLWHDGQIVPGTDWSHEIDQRLDTASFILLLVSPDFIHSDYCYSKEMQRALERHEIGTAQVIPLLLRPVDWKGTPIGALQALPTSALPITKWPNQDEAFEDAAKGIREAIKEFISQRKLQQDQQVSNVPENASQQVAQDHTQPPATLEKRIQQALSDAQLSPLTSRERNVIISLLRGIPSRQITMFLRLWDALGYSLHRDIFSTWREIAASVRNGLLHMFEEVLEVWSRQSLEDREEAIEGFFWNLIDPSLEDLRTDIESSLQNWKADSEEEHMRAIDELSQVWDEYSEQERSKVVQEFIQSSREEVEDPVEIVEATIQEWKAALEDPAENAKDSVPQYGGYPPYSEQQPYSQPYPQPSNPYSEQQPYGQPPYQQPSNPYSEQPQGYPPDDNS